MGKVEVILFILKHNIIFQFQTDLFYNNFEINLIVRKTKKKKKKTSCVFIFLNIKQSQLYR